MKKFLFIIIIIFFTNKSYSYDLFETSFHKIEFISNNIENDKINKIKNLKKVSLLNIFKNALDRARMRQASRLFKSDRDQILTKAELVTIEAEDLLKSRVFSSDENA